MPLHSGQVFHGPGGIATQLFNVHAGKAQQVGSRAPFLVQQRRHEVQRLDKLVIAPQRQALSVS